MVHILSVEYLWSVGDTLFAYKNSFAQANFVLQLLCTDYLLTSVKTVAFWLRNSVTPPLIKPPIHSVTQPLYLLYWEEILRS